MEKAAAFLSGKQELLLRTYWDAFLAAVHASKQEEAMDAVALPPGPVPVPEAEALLQMTMSLSSAVTELREAGGAKHASKS